MMISTTIYEDYKDGKLSLEEVKERISTLIREYNKQYPLSESQKGLWALQKITPGMSAYNCPICYRIYDGLNLDAFKRACDLLVKQYPILTTVILEENGVPRQKTQISRPCVIQEEDISTLAPHEVVACLNEKAKEPFVLDQGPLFRVCLFQRTEKETIVLFTIHHIIFDGGSYIGLIKTVLDLYRDLVAGKAPKLSRPEQTYPDYVAKERAMLEGPDGRRRLTHWREQLKGSLPRLEIPTDHPRSVSQNFKGKTYHKSISGELGARLRKFTQTRMMYLSTLFLGVFKLLLYRYSGQTDLIIGMASDERPADTEALIGFYLNMLPIRSRIRGDNALAGFLKELQLTLVNGLAHSYPLPALVRELKIPTSNDNAPVFQVAFLYQNFIGSTELDHLQDQYRPELSMAFVDGIYQEGEYEMTLEVFEHENEFALNLKYNPDLYEASTIARMMGHYTALLETVTRNPDGMIRDCTLLTPKEERRILVDWNNTGKEYPAEKCIHDLIEHQAQKTPDKIALVYEGAALTYQELDQKSRTLAIYLRQQGIGPGSLVGICVERSLEMLVGLLGILKSGAAYVPLDPDYPGERLAYMITDSQVSMILTQAPIKDRLPDTGAAPFKRILLDQDWEKIEKRITGTPSPLKKVPSSQLAYVIYTSGSTGKPKGVMISHRALVNFMLSMAEQPGIAAHDTLLAVTTYCFDIAALELFLPLLAGARVAICPAAKTRDAARLIREIETVKPTIMQATPSSWTMLFRAGWQNQEKVKILCGGEALPRKLHRQFAATGSDAWNMFGPTETTIWSTVKHLEKDEDVSIGKPIANTRVYILDPNLRPTAVGVYGELCIAGDGLARGYLNQPELTEQKFIENPLDPETRLYRTGDLARWLPDGNIEYSGRMDHQVKLRGFRIELEEIENSLNKHEDIEDSAVTVMDNAGHKQLVAWYVPGHGDEPVNQGRLREYLRARLPAYMVPSMFVTLNTFPLTPNGKLDRKALSRKEVPQSPRPMAPHPEKEEADLPPIEEKILGIWREALNRDDIQREDGFFDVGGDSILAVTVAERIKRRLKVDFSVTTLFKYPNIDAISRHILKTKKEKGLKEPLPAAGPTVSAPAGATEPAPDDAAYPDYYQDSLAIIGISCNFPGAKDHYTFWRNLREGKESLTFLSEKEIGASGLPRDIIKNPNFVPVQSTIEGKDLFDPGFFGISPKDAAFMDPQFRLLLLHSWQAIEDAGYVAKSIPETSVFMSAGNNFYAGQNTETEWALSNADEYVYWLLAQSGSIPTMISHKLGLKGASLAVHANCSSSLVGLSLAYQNIRAGKSRHALVGAASIFPTSNLGYIHQPGMNFSSDGHLKAFDAAADGMIGGEGVAVVLLKKAVDAIEDKDHIYALLRGIEINNDGNEKVGFYAPSVKGQSNVIQKALETTGVHPESIGYVEAHGTGTKLGDPVEISALTEVYRQYTEKQQYCGIGSVKTNIGHLDTAAGLAGCIKVALSLYHKEIPPTINYKEPNPDIDLENSPFFVLDKLKPLSGGTIPARAALSSFGIGGTNTHALFEQYDNPESGHENGSFLVPISARNEEQLKAYAEKLLEFIEHGSVAVPDLAYTFQVGREAMKERLAVVADNQKDLKKKLSAYLKNKLGSQGISRGSLMRGKGETDLLIEGESGKEFIKIVVKKKAIAKLAQLWASGVEVDWRLLYQKQMPSRISLPTYPFAKESFRGPKSDNRVPNRENRGKVGKLHTMLHKNTSNLSEQKFSSIFDGDEFYITEHIIQGRKVLPAAAFLEMALAAVENALEDSDKKQTITCLTNVVWGPPIKINHQPREVHISLLPETKQKIAYEIYCTPAQADTRPIVYNQGHVQRHVFTEAPTINLSALRTACNQELLAANQIYDALKAAGVNYGPSFKGIENVYVGTGQVLIKLNIPSSISGTQHQFMLHPSIMESVFQAAGILVHGSKASKVVVPTALKEAQVFGPIKFIMWALIRYREDSRIADKNQNIDIDLSDETGNVKVRIKGLKTRTLSQHSATIFPEAETREKQTSHLEEDYELMTFEEVWHTKPVSCKSQVKIKNIVCFLSDPAYQQVVKKTVNNLDPRTEVIFVSKSPGDRRNFGQVYFVEKDDADSYVGAFKCIAQDYGQIDAMLYLWPFEDADCIKDTSGIVFILQALAVVEAKIKRFQLAGPFKNGMEQCYVEAWIGFVRSLGLVAPDIKVAALYYDVGGQHTKDAITIWTKYMWEELQNHETGSVLYRKDLRHISRIRQAPIETGEQILKSGKTYLITGGLGGLGLLFAKHMARKYSTNLIIVGRSAIDEEKRSKLKSLEKLGGQVHYLQVDVCNATALQEGLNTVKKRLGAVHGVIHAAGIESDQNIFEKNIQSFNRVLTPKIKGTVTLDEVLKNEPLDFVCYFSSSSAILGDFGSCDYAIANRFQMAYGRYRKNRPYPGKTFVINWPLWRDGGMGLGDEENTKMYLKTSGQRFLEIEEGIDIFERVLSQKKVQRLVVAGKPSRVKRFLYSIEKKSSSFISRTRSPIANVRRHGMKGMSVEQCLTWDLHEITSQLLKIPREKLKINENLSDLGYDSISLTKFAAKLTENLGLQIKPSLFYGYTTLNRLLKYFLEEHSNRIETIYQNEMPEPVQDNSADGGLLKPIKRLNTRFACAQVSKIEREAIAIIGMSGRFPQARNIEQMWEILANGEEVIRSVPEDRYVDWEHKDLVDIKCGFIDGVDEFDSLFFEISPIEAENMDPRQRLLLQESWRAMEDAGYGETRTGMQKIGMFVGVEEGDYPVLTKGQGSIVSNHNGILAARLSYFLNLNGPNMAINTACSSGLVAVHQACQAIHGGECDSAIAAGINLMLTPIGFSGMSDAGMLSKEGRCNAFSERANGMVPGEAVAVVVLKRLSRAQADNDRIYATIKGSGINYDGKTNGITAPSGVSQTELLKTVYDHNQIDPKTVEYIVTHGTGTKLGDPVEINALNDAFRIYTDKQQYCAITSNKTNFGHTFAPSGILNLINLVQAMMHETIPASINCDRENEYIEWKESPFYVNKHNKSWPRKAYKSRVGAVSAFGMSGTNAHMVVQSYNRDEPAENIKQAYGYLLALSAKSEEVLKIKINDLIRHLKGKRGEKQSLSQISCTLLEGRYHFNFRCAIVIRDKQDAVLALQQANTEEKLPNLFKGEIPHGFKGTKATRQYAIGLLRQCQNLAVNKKKYRQALYALAELYCLGYDLPWHKLFSANEPGFTDLPTYPFVRDRHWVSLSEDRKQIAKNGDNYRKIHPLLHRNTSDFQRQSFCSTFTGKEFFLKDHVVQGEKILPGVAYLEMVRAAVEQSIGSWTGDHKGICLTNIAWIRPISVNGSPAQVKVGLSLEENNAIAFKVYQQPDNDNSEPTVHSQGHAKLETLNEKEKIELSAIKAKCNRRVLLSEQCYQSYKSKGFDYGPGFQGLEQIFVGSGQVLAKLSMPESVVETKGQFVLHPSMMDAALQATVGLADESGNDRPLLPFALEELNILDRCTGSMWAFIALQDNDIDESKIHKLDVWISDDDGHVKVKMKGLTSRYLDNKIKGQDEKSIEMLMIYPFWKAQKIKTKAHPVKYKNHTVFICDLRKITSKELEAKLNSGNCQTFESTEKNLSQRYQYYCDQIFVAIQTIIMKKPDSRVLIQIVVPNQDEFRLLSGLSGLIKTAGLENPMLVCQLIEVDPEEEVENIAVILKENSRASGDTHICYVENRRFVVGWKEERGKFEKEHLPWKENGVYLITGGAGGLGLIFAKEIAENLKSVRLVLVGRTGLDTERKDRLKMLEKLGANVDYRRVDVTNENEVKELIESIRKEQVEIRGIIHAAGVVHDNYILKKSRIEIQQVLSPKVAGLLAVDRATRDELLDFFVLFSSSSGALGNIGQADYAAANSFMDAYASYRNNLVKAGERYGQTLSVNWPLWQEGGMNVDPVIKDIWHQQNGMISLPTQDGVRALYEGLSSGHHQVLVLAGDLKRLRNEFLNQKKENDDVIDYREHSPISLTGHDEVYEQAVLFLKNLLSSVIRLPAHRIDAGAPLEKYGIDSLMVIKLTSELEKTFGSLSKTLFFEYQNLRDLSSYFVKFHKEKLLESLRVANSGVGYANHTNERVKPSVLKLQKQSELSLLQNQDQINERRKDEEIAIIGMAGRYPQANNLNEFWNNLKESMDCITEVPKDRWDHDLYFDEDKNKRGKTYCKWGGFIDDVDKFDPLFFNISPLEAEVIDPQERLFLECVYNTIEDAGYTRHELSSYQSKGISGNVGVYVGVMYEEYQLYGAQAQAKGQFFALSGNPSSIANRVSYFCNFDGPSMAIDTMCSSSLTSIHLACQSILNGGCHVAIAGGVNVSVHPNKYLMLAQGNFASSNGRCQSFGEGGDGYVPGEGVGAILLKPISKAVEDKDHIYGIIMGTTINHGGKTNGYTVPNPKAQAKVIKEAIKRSGINPREISYLEAHGTGTSLGDPIEITGLTNAYQEFTKDKQFCAIGSVKSNIGHCESAAGIAGVTKVLLQIKHRQLVPSIHSKVLNPNIDFKTTPFWVNQKLTAWKQPRMSVDSTVIKRPRIAGISSFGAGGSNAHVIIAEHIQKNEKKELNNESIKKQTIIVLSAKNEDRLNMQIKNMLIELENKRYSEKDLVDIAYTLQVGREPMEERLGLIVGSLSELKIKLQKLMNGRNNIENYFRGRITEKKDTLSVFSVDEDLSEAVENWINKKKIIKLLDFWVRGLNFDWKKLYNENIPRRISLPTYPFSKRRCWVSTSDQYQNNILPENSSNRGKRFYIKKWVQSENVKDREAINGTVIVLGTTGTDWLSSALFREMKNVNMLIVMHAANEIPQVYTTDFYSEDSGEHLYKKISGLLRTERLLGVIDVTAYDRKYENSKKIESGKIAFLQSLIEYERSQKFLLLQVTHKLQAFKVAETSMYGARTVGLYRMLSAEYGQLRSMTMDTDCSERELKQLVQQICIEFTAKNHSKLSECCYRDNKRFEPQVAEAPTAETNIKINSSKKLYESQEVVLITGGSKGIGAVIGRHIVEKGVKKLVIFGRESLPAEKQWDQLLQGKNNSKHVSKLRYLQALKEKGVDVHYSNTALTDYKGLKKELKRIAQTMGLITGVFHCAGSVSPNPAFIKKRINEIEKVCEPKIEGLQILHSVLEKEPLKYFILFSSVASLAPKMAAGQSDYSMANAFMDHFAMNQAMQGKSYFKVIQWPQWREVGMAAGKRSSAVYQEAGLKTIKTTEGLSLLDSLMQSSLTISLPNMSENDNFRYRSFLHAKSFSEDKSKNNRDIGYHKTETWDEKIKSSKKYDLESIKVWLRNTIISELKLMPNDLEDKKTFDEYGIDSIILVQLVENFKQKVKADLDPSIILEHNSINDLSEYFMVHHKDAFNRHMLKKSNNSHEKNEKKLIDENTETLEKEFKTFLLSDSIREEIDDEIAVIGLACRFPESPNKEKYWELLSEGATAIRPVSENRWSIKNSDKYYGGWIDGINLFDPQFFNIKENDAAIMDPQARIILEECLKVIYDAGYDHRELSGKKIAVYIGGRLQSEIDINEILKSSNPILGVGQNFMATNVSRFFNFNGPSMVVDTACSSGITGMALARDALNNRRIDMAIVGAVSLLANPFAHELFRARDILGEENEFHIFDKRSNGEILGEGAGVVMLKRLKDAIKDGNHIYAVIKSLSQNNDGRTLGPASPNINAQKQVIQEALEASKMSREDVGYIEVNGGGSPVVDSVEIKALDSVYDLSNKDLPVCYLGSVKPNIGHLLLTSGVAGFIRCVLSVYHKKIPPFLSAYEPFEYYDFETSRVNFNRKSIEWKIDKEQKRVAALNSFPDGGTNCHIIIEEFVPYENYVEKYYPKQPPNLRMKRVLKKKEIDRSIDDSYKNNANASVGSEMDRLINAFGL